MSGITNERSLATLPVAIVAVASTADGDTLTRLNGSGYRRKIRLAGIEAHAAIHLPLVC